MKIALAILLLGLLCILGCGKSAAEKQKEVEAQKLQEERWAKTQKLADERAALDTKKQATQEAAQHKRAKAGISYDDNKVRIRNMDSSDWPEMNVYINGDPLFGYGIRIHELKSGESVTISLEQFTKDNGERFNPNNYRVVKLWIGGGDFDYVAYGSQ